jgi:trimeric autotransporter adhesin
MPILGVIASSAKGAPGIPTSVSATDVGTARAYNNGAATVSFTAGAGAPATSFTATSSPGGFTATGASSPLTVSGLQSNTAYTFTVTATNAAGTSAASAASASITATTVPQAPTIGTPTCATGQAYTGSANISVAFTAGATGGKAISSYTATSSSSATGSGASSPVSVSQTVGSSYTYTVTATNANGTSTASGTSASVLAASVPSTPTIGTATGGNASASITYTGSAATGGSAITGYTMTSSPGSLTGTGASPITVSGLTNGTAYTFTVRATNAFGTSAASSASNSITPASPYWVEVITGGIGTASNIQMAGTSMVYSSQGGSPRQVATVDNTGAITAQHQWTAGGTTGVWNTWGLWDSVNSRRIFTGFFRPNSSTSLTPGIFALNSSNTVVFSAYNNNTTGYSWASNRAAIGNGFVAMGGYWQGGDPSNYPCLMLFDSSGSCYYCLILNNTSPSGGSAQTAAIYNNSTDAFFGGSEYSTTVSRPFFCKVTSGGSVSWARTVSSTTGTGVCASAVSSNSYNPVAVVSATSNTWNIISFSASTGAIVWQRAITGATSLDDSADIAMDSNGFIYFIMRGIISGQYTTTIFKYNSSGALQWQRRIFSPNNYAWDRITTDGNNIFLGSANAPGQLLYYPADGSLTGSFTWQGFAFTIATGVLTDSAGSQTVSTLSTTNGNYNSFSAFPSVPTVATTSYTIRDRLSL